ncbi:ATP-dependent Clp protease proteolytic subunit [Hepatocystis sp. ex Piliocolobus tephrosceles]|nr:ATP-dependent Clp protease proteolytic subunit [Hepatocystis sp. ex Piliocolobus tephrosceles]
MIYLLLFFYFILLKNNKTKSQKNFKKPNHFFFLHSSHKNILKGKLKKKTLNFRVQKNESILKINKNEQEQKWRWRCLLHNVSTDSKEKLLNNNNSSSSNNSNNSSSSINNSNNSSSSSNNSINSSNNSINSSNNSINSSNNSINSSNNSINSSNNSMHNDKNEKKKNYKKREKLISFKGSIKDIKKDIKLYFFKKRIIYLTEEINKKTCDEIISQLLYLDSLNNKDIRLYINSPGGSINEGLAILDIFNYIKSDIQTISFGLVASMASVILASGKKGKRKSLPNCRIMIHQPLGNAFGDPHDIEIQTKEIIYLKKLLYSYLSKFTNQTIETIEKHSDRDYYMNALEAKNYGIIDEVIETKLPHPYF